MFLVVSYGVVFKLVTSFLLVLKARDGSIPSCPSGQGGRYPTLLFSPISYVNHSLVLVKGSCIVVEIKCLNDDEGAVSTTLNLMIYPSINVVIVLDTSLTKTQEAAVRFLGL